MTQTSLSLPQCLADWIDRNMPEVGGVRSVKFLCCDAGDIPFDWLSIFSSTLRDREGFTFGRTIYFRRATSQCCPLDPCNLRAIELILHELVHAESFRKNPLTFPIIYLIKLIGYGYDNHPDEVEARRRAQNLRATYDREDPCNCRPVTPATAPVATQLTQTEIERCCSSPNNQDPTIEFTPSSTARPGGQDISIKVTARQACGIRKLVLRPSIAIGTNDNPLPTLTDGGSDCLSFRTLTASSFVQTGASLKVTAEATNCCGRTATRTILQG